MNLNWRLLSVSCLLLTAACGRTDFGLLLGDGGEDTAGSDTLGDGETQTDGSSESVGESSTGDGDPGDGDPGDGDPGDGDPGDGDPGDGDPGDGDPGDGDPGDGDPGDGDPGDGDPGDGDGDPSGCMDSSDCDPGNCVLGSCEVVATCLELEQLDPNLPSGVYELDHDGPGGDAPYSNYCDLETDGGGWTLILKANGGSLMFTYNSTAWTSATPFSINNSDLDHQQAKLPSWQWVDFTQVMVGMEAPIGADPDPLVLETLILDVAAGSLFDLISPNNYVQTNVGRGAWLGLMQNSTLQPSCNREGFNVTGDNLQQWHRVRIGIIGNEQNNCSSPDSRLGIGGTGSVCNTSGDPTGNFVGCNGGNNRNTPAFGVVFVR